jgi:hypothetical protein
MKKKEIDEFELLQGQLQSFSDDLNTLAKKSPHDELNKFKLGLVNSVLQKANTFLGNTRKPFADFEQFEDASIPSNSDVLVMVSQYLSAFEKLRTENITWTSTGWFWVIDGERDSSRRTAPPKNLDH